MRLMTCLRPAMSSGLAPPLVLRLTDYHSHALQRIRRAPKWARYTAILGLYDPYAGLLEGEAMAQNVSGISEAICQLMFV